MIEGMDSQMRQSMPGGGMNPFADVTGGSAPAVAAPAAPAVDHLKEDFAAALTTLCGNEKAVVATALDLIVKMVQNIVNNPGEQKYMKIKMGNPAIVKKVTNVDGGTELVNSKNITQKEEKSIKMNAHC